MKKQLIGLLTLTSITAFANDCRVKIEGNVDSQKLRNALTSKGFEVISSELDNSTSYTMVAMMDQFEDGNKEYRLSLYANHGKVFETQFAQGEPCFAFTAGEKICSPLRKVVRTFSKSDITCPANH